MVDNCVPRRQCRCALNPEAWGCMWTCLPPPPPFPSSPICAPPPPLLASLPPYAHTHTHTHVPQCVWLVAQTLSIRIALQRSGKEGEKRAYISNLCRALLFSVRTQRNGSPACSNSRANINVMKPLPATHSLWNQFLHLFSIWQKHVINAVGFFFLPTSLSSHNLS